MFRVGDWGAGGGLAPFQNGQVGFFGLQNADLKGGSDELGTSKPSKSAFWRQKKPIWPFWKVCPPFQNQNMSVLEAEKADWPFWVSSQEMGQLGGPAAFQNGQIGFVGLRNADLEILDAGIWNLLMRHT